LLLSSAYEGCLDPESFSLTSPMDSSAPEQ